jgi:lysophospholipase L1-like esterase
VKRAAILALAWLSIGAFSAAATDYWAFGDSITRGSGDPIKPEVAFDKEDFPTGPCPREACGYNWRLQSALAAEGISNVVINRGWGAEDTLLGKSRIDDPGEPLYASRCADPNAGDVLLLMEGTNDVSGILSGSGATTTSVRNNLAFMLDLATTKCVHSAIASTVTRLLAGTSDGSNLGDWNEPVTLDLATKISSLAAQRNRPYVDVLNALCRDADPDVAQGCYDTHFWGRLSANDPGHVDRSGYDVMAPVFEVVILASPAAGAASLSAPEGDITSATPSFVWTREENSDWYFLEVDGGSSYGRWHPEEAVCSAGTCSVTPTVMLADGAHNWRVRTRNLRGVADWSAAGSFTVWTNPPGPVTLEAPEGDLFESTPYTPTYEWQAATDANGYELEVEDASESVVVAETYDSSICTLSDCSDTPTTGLAAGEYLWRVRATNPAGAGPWSDFMAFTIYDSVPGAPTSLSPLDDVFDTTPMYRWRPVPGATAYDVRVDGTIPGVLDGLNPAVVCTSSVCGVEQPDALAVGTHTWRVRGSNPFGDGSESAEVTYEVLDCASWPDLEVGNTSLPPFEACVRLYTDAIGGFTVGAAATVEFHAGDIVELWNGFSVESGGSFTARVDY